MTAQSSPAISLPDRPPLAAAIGSAAISLNGYRLRLTALLLAALTLQVCLLRAGVERLSSDESARSLLAHGLTWANALEPFIWPPFTKLLIGLALKLQDDVFLVPRLLSGLAGLGVML